LLDVTTIQRQEEAPVPFFTDTRSLPEKLRGDSREWRPHQPEHDCPSMIFGLVIERGEYVSSCRDSAGNNKAHDTARVLTHDNIVWSVIGFHGYLQSEFDRKQPAVGDFVAVAYQGTKPARKQGESDAHVYQIEVERNPAGPKVDDRGSELLPGSDPAPPIPVVDDDVQRMQGDGDIPF
jgi:hypothetical protein